MDVENEDEAYPRISQYAVLTIEGYCMLNINYSRKKDPFNYKLNPDGSFEKVENPDYDPTCLPDPYPENCLRFVNTDCISCIHFGWCDYEEEADEESEYSPHE